ncbi:MAG TPA: PaaI family thioesterase [Xanthobacteraceae bacterium]|nr:PaaI family thioesterase [Xanthobacteraceae bacterium]
MNQSPAIRADRAASDAAVRTRTVTWEDPLAAARAGASLSGIAFLRAVAQGQIPAPPIALLLGLDIDEVEEGRVVFTCEPDEYHYNPIGVVHGGLAATLLDSAMGCAVHSRLPQGRGYTTLEIKVNYVRAITRESGRLRAIASVVHMGGKIATAEGRIVDAAGQIYAHATTTCILLGGSPGAG